MGSSRAIAAKASLLLAGILVLSTGMLQTDSSTRNPIHRKMVSYNLAMSLNANSSFFELTALNL